MSTELLAEFEAANGTPGGKCQYARAVARLSAEQRQKLDAAMAAVHIQSAAIHRVLGEWGVDAGKDTVARHRRGECKSCA